MEHPDQYTLVLKKRQPRPDWLKPYQQRMSDAMKIAAEETRHLVGPERVKAMNRIASDILRRTPESPPQEQPGP